MAISKEVLASLKECLECAEDAVDKIRNAFHDVAAMYDLQDRLENNVRMSNLELQLHDGDVHIDLTHMLMSGKVPVGEIVGPLAAGQVEQLRECRKFWREVRDLGDRGLSETGRLIPEAIPAPAAIGTAAS